MISVWGLVITVHVKFCEKLFQATIDLDLLYQQTRQRRAARDQYNVRGRTPTPSLYHFIPCTIDRWAVSCLFGSEAKCAEQWISSNKDATGDKAESSQRDAQVSTMKNTAIGSTGIRDTYVRFVYTRLERLYAVN